MTNIIILGLNSQQLITEGYQGVKTGTLLTDIIAELENQSDNPILPQIIAELENQPSENFWDCGFWVPGLWDECRLLRGIIQQLENQ